jgi:hypothetical protein
MDPWGPTGASIQLPRRFLLSNHHFRTFCACCDTSPSGTLSLLNKIRIGTRQTITIPDETTIPEFFIRSPEIVFSSHHDSSHLPWIPYSSIITISYDQWGN